MNKVALKKILKDVNSNSDKDDLYRKINFTDKESKFNNNDKLELTLMCMYLYHLNKGIDTLTRHFDLPFPINRDISYNDFKTEISKYKKYRLSINGLESLSYVKNHYDNIIRIGANKILGADDLSWIKIYHTKVTGDANNIDVYGKIYLSIDNSDLYLFSRLLLAECLATDLTDFEFKTNNDEKINRTNNLVIYFTKDNFNKYLKIIHKILQANPNIKFNENQILGYELSDNVVVLKDAVGGGSFTQSICELILSFKDLCDNDDEIIGKLDDIISIHLNNIIELSKN